MKAEQKLQTSGLGFSEECRKRLCCKLSQHMVTCVTTRMQRSLRGWVSKTDEVADKGITIEVGN